MTDIVERLRGHFLVGSVDDTPDPLLQEAADEIEHLRTELMEFTELKEYAKSLDQETYLELHAKNERLTALNTELVTALKGVITAYESKLGKEYPAGIQKAMRQTHMVNVVLKSNAKVKE